MFLLERSDTTRENGAVAVFDASVMAYSLLAAYCCSACTNLRGEPCDMGGTHACLQLVGRGPFTWDFIHFYESGLRLTGGSVPCYWYAAFALPWLRGSAGIPATASYSIQQTTYKESCVLTC